MGHPGGDGQKAIRAIDWNLGVRSGLRYRFVKAM